MFTYPKLSTFYGYVRAAEPDRIVIPTDPACAMTMAARVDREADAELQAGHHVAADRLAHLAYELRARAVGGRL